MVKVSKNSLMEDFMMGHGKMTKCMEKELFNGRMVLDTQVITIMAIKKDQVFSNGQVGKSL
jgi:hypothetical protein